MNKLSWNSHPKIGWWKDLSMLTLYHGTHVRNLDDIMINGIDKPDPKTGMISVTLDPNTAYGYAAMSGAGGESTFRASKKPVHTPENQRIVLVMKFSKSFILSHMNPDLRGNVGEASENMRNKTKYQSYIGSKTYPDDASYYALTEIRLNTTISPQYIIGYMKKK